MRISTLSFGLLALLTPLTAAWSKEDREIFRVRDELIAGEGKDVTFYDFLGVPPSASVEDISKAYRKRSRSLHPDKVKQQLRAERAQSGSAQNKKDKARGKKPKAHVAKPPTKAEIKAAVQLASERQARLSIVVNVLKGPGRDRYDHFLSNGFPTWKGTNYYYNRYRPGLGTALFGVFLVGGGAAHYLALYMGWKRQREFVDRYIRFARRTAWGDDLGIPGVDAATRAAPPPPPPAAADDSDGPPMPMNRKQRRLQERESKRGAAKEAGRAGRRRGIAGANAGSGTATPTPQSSGPTGAKKRVVAENGKVLVVDSLGDVYLEEEDEDGNVEEFLLDANEIQKPTFKDTAVYRLPVWAYQLTVGRVLKKKSAEDDDDDVKEEEETAAADVDIKDEDDDSEPGKRTPSTDSAEDFELLEKSTDSLAAQAKTTARQTGGKASKRKGKKK